MIDMRDAGLLVLRIGVGGVLFAHGAQKLLGWFGGQGIAGTAGAFKQMGFEPARESAIAAGLGEAGGGALIVLGLATPAAGAGAVGTMVPAVSFHAPQGFFAIGGGFEYPAVLGMSAAALALIDPGEWSMDAILRHRLNRPWMAAAALITSAGMSTALVRRRHRVLAARADAAQADTHSPDSARSPAPVPGSEWMDGQ